jgi:hypothetical protein
MNDEIFWMCQWVEVNDISTFPRTNLPAAEIMDWSLKESHSLAVIMDKMGDPRTCSTLITDCNQASAGFLCFDYLLLQRIAKSESLFIRRRRWVSQHWQTCPFQDLLTLDLSAGCFEWTELHERVRKSIEVNDCFFLLDFLSQNWMKYLDIRLDCLLDCFLPRQCAAFAIYLLIINNFKDGADSWIKVFGWSLETNWLLPERCQDWISLRPFLNWIAIVIVKTF